MNVISHEKYHLSVNGKDFILDKYSEVVTEIKSALDAPNGKLLLTAEDGTRPWWQK